MAEQKKNDTVSKDEKKERVRQEFLELRRTGDPKLRNKLITDHLYIAEILAKKYVNRGIEFDDLYQVASMGLIYAIDRYDVTKGFEFSSFATPTIVGELKRYFRDKGWVIRVPRRIQELSKRVNQVKVSLIQELQRQPTVDDIADALGVSAEEVLEAMDSSKVYAPQSLDQTMDSSNDDHDVNLGNLIGQDDKSFEQVDFYDVIERLSKGLNDLEKRIFYDRYYDKRTQIAIAEELGVSQMTVSRIEKKIIEKFRQELNIRPEDLSKKRKSVSNKRSKKEN
ncbi:MAG: SigB/SigF/SigG family RNA polymerase sigma factor [Peptoniphilaceae bacterium]|nr:SigB/SigF/SigG family RNA polymerase sigma factor [Peptoniphilaceae bacterium]MCI6660344.1 SigB/SigF/SigG family RNA polymerase sigma factor [Peptoniphilaceae bacterium]MDD7434051.1 SigB/SigF/SigG family RNA polymerase sigma factor [Peptoniphilaceae bacterium]MDY3075800.1 SigB/SigF/SigG family RNA polymerase sigma factor [Peptoniphilaceae bacterium]MDY3986878.1 SigB/SigF/SigG family RNA polymerase sigma factor [Peptoniphilaceae bacterium]